MNTLEDILVALGSKKPFLDKIIIDEDGGRQPFTKGGAKAYEKLTEILYAVGELMLYIERLKICAMKDY